LRIPRARGIIGKSVSFWRKRIEGKEVVTFHRGYSNETMTFTINRVKTERGTIEIHLGKRVKGLTR